MNRKATVGCFHVVFVLSAVSLATCDGAPGSGQDLDVAEAAFSESSCGSSTLSPHRSFSGKVDPRDVSAQSYNKCTKSWIVDIEALLSEYTGPGAGGGPPATIAVTWADAPLTAAACTGAIVDGILYRRVFVGGTGGAMLGTGGRATSEASGSSPFVWVSLGRKDSAGVWGGAIAGCMIGVRFEGMFPGETYRVAATARVADGTTRKVGIQTLRPVILH